MRTLALLVLLLPVCSAAEPTLTAKDKRDIRIAIEAQAKAENEKGTNEIWSERGPLIYHVRNIEAIDGDVAMAETDGVSSGTFPEHDYFLFILSRSSGRWTVSKKVQICKPVRMMPVAGLPRSSARDFLGCPG
jgi:hypothetical protein